jgi:hypothetical protein
VTLLIPGPAGTTVSAPSPVSASGGAAASREAPETYRPGEVAPWEGRDLPPGVYRWGVAAATALGAALRVAHIARPFNRLMAWNEGHYAMIALNFDRYGLWSQRNELGVDRTFSPGVPWLIWVSFKAFGPTEWAARLPIVLAGVAALVFLAALARRLLRSEQVALIAVAFAACAPGLVYFAQNVQLDTPSICCALAGAVLMLRYRETRRRRALVGAGLCLAAAIWFKFTAALFYPAFLGLWVPARPVRTVPAVAEAGAFVGGTALPSVLWIVSRWLTPWIAAPASLAASGSALTWEFFHRDWSLAGLAKALSEIPLAVEAHLFFPIFLLLLVGIPVAVRWRARLRDVWLWCAPWLALYVLAPWDSLVNRYYDLPATYLLTVLAAIGLWSTRRRRRALAVPSGVAAVLGDGVRPHLPGGPSSDATTRAGASTVCSRALATGLAIVVALTVAYDLWDPMTDRIARATMAHAAPIDPTPFYSARLVARLPRGLTVVDTPQTMFYAGGDPAWIRITGGDVRWKIDGETFDYVVLNDYGHGQEPYYPIDAALRARLADHGYVQAGPAVWAHERTRIADLGGYREPGVPYWAPWPPWRLRGMGAWR